MKLSKVLGSLIVFTAPLLYGQQPLVTDRVDEAHLVTLKGNVPPAANARFDAGRVSPNMALGHMQLQLKRSPAQESEVKSHIDELHNPKSPNFHKWMTAAEFGERFGASEQDVQQVSDWLRSHGLQVESVNSAHNALQFSGNVAQVEEAFHTEIHSLNVNGVQHISNMSEPSIPQALSSIVVGAPLSDFKPHPLVTGVREVRRDLRSGGYSPVYESGATAHPNTAVPYSGKTLQFVGPQDFATIYNLNPAWKAGYRGKGQTVAVVEDTFMKAADVTTFRKAFGFFGYAGTFSQVSPAGTVPCQNPGINSNETEAALDAEWAGATAPDAAIVLAACADTRTQGGEFIALMDLLDQKNPPDAISLSYGLCEPAMGVVTAAQISSAYQQAAAEGVSIFVSSGDQGAASCDYGAEEAVYGIATNGLATTPYNVAVGGTDFYDTIQKTGNQYWHASNGAGLESAISYIPEKTWNDSCADSDVMAYFGATQAYGSNGACAQYPGDVYGLNTGAGSGGPSTVYPKSYASWQTGVYGLPADHSRDIPDVSLFSSDGQWWGHAMLFCNSDVRTWDVPCVYTNSKDAVYSTAGGTSFAAPAMAGIFALITQKYGRQGNPAYGL